MDFGNYETRILSLEEIHGFYFAFHTYYPNMIVITTVAGASIHVVMEIINEDSYRLYYTDAMAEQELWYIGDDLLQFLNALLTFYGAPYWEWCKRSDEFILKVE